MGWGGGGLDSRLDADGIRCEDGVNPRPPLAYNASRRRLDALATLPHNCFDREPVLVSGRGPVRQWQQCSHPLNGPLNGPV
jgi:hypothetical protein